MSQSNGTKAKMNDQVPQDLPDPEVVPTAKRRQFSAAYKRRILAEAEACSKPGEVGTFYLDVRRSGTVFKFNPAQRLRALFGWSSSYRGEL